jgi:hypothetical protein
MRVLGVRLTLGPYTKISDPHSLSPHLQIFDLAHSLALLVAVDGIRKVNVRTVI